MAAARGVVRAESMEKTLTVRVRAREGVSVFHLAGVLDFYSGSVLKAEFVRCRPKAMDTFIMDMSELAYIDSAGIGSLVFLHAQMRRIGGSMYFAKISDGVSRVLMVSGIKSMLNVISDEQYASMLWLSA